MAVTQYVRWLHLDVGRVGYTYTGWLKPGGDIVVGWLHLDVGRVGCRVGVRLPHRVEEAVRVVEDAALRCTHVRRCIMIYIMCPRGRKIAHTCSRIA